MHQYWYLNSKGNGEQYTNQISLYSQPEITKSEVMNDLKIPENGVTESIQLVGIHQPIIRDSLPNPPFSWGSSQLIIQG